MQIKFEAELKAKLKAELKEIQLKNKIVEETTKELKLIIYNNIERLKKIEKAAKEFVQFNRIGNEENDLMIKLIDALEEY